MSRTSPTPRDWEKEKRIAEMATTCEWRHSGTVIYFESGGVLDAEDEMIAETFNVNAEADAAFIAAFNPATVLELIAEVEQLNRMVKMSGKAGMALAEATVESVDQSADLREQLSQLKAERDRMAEALGAAVEMTDKIVGQISKAQSDWEQNNDHAAFDELCDWTYDGLIASYHSQYCEALPGRSALNTGEKTDD